MNLSLFAMALLCGPLVLEAPLASLPALAATLWIWFAHRRSPQALLAAAVLLLFGVARATRAISVGKRDRYESQFSSPQECDGKAIVLGRSRAHRDAEGTRFSGLVETSLLRCTKREGDVETYSLEPPLRMMLTAPTPLHRGDSVSIEATVALVSPWDNPGALDRGVADASRAYAVSASARRVTLLAASRSIVSLVDRARDAVREHIWASYPSDVESLVRALVIGEADLRPEDTDALKGSGLLHLLAVSGMHLVVVLGALQRALHFLLVRVEMIAARVDAHRLASAFVGAVAFAYADFAGGSGSAWRAAWMSGVVACVTVLERMPCAKRSLALSVVAMAILDPLAVFDVSLILSVLATAGLLLSTQHSKENYLYRSVRATAAATIPCAPLLAKMGGNLSIGAFMANLIAVPLGEIITLPACLLEPLCGSFPSLQASLVALGSGGLRAVMAIADTVNKIDFLQVGVPLPSALQVSVLIAGAILTLARNIPTFGREGTKGALAPIVATIGLLSVLEWKMRTSANSKGELSMLALDVGQGDATLIHFPDGQWGLIDAGGLIGPGVDVGARVIAPVLRSLRVSELALVVLSHPHPDHFGGMKTGLVGVSVGRVWDTGQGEREGIAGEYPAWLGQLRRARVPILRPNVLCGVHFLYGAEVSVLAPCPASDSTHTPNDNSFVIKVRYKERAFLLVGDAERYEEELLLRTQFATLHADVLKVGHHGSRTSSSAAFLAAVSPVVATMSSGVRNRFGHPHPKTIEALMRANVRVFRTDRSGAIRITTDGRQLRVEVAR